MNKEFLHRNDRDSLAENRILSKYSDYRKLSQLNDIT